VEPTGKSAGDAGVTVMEDNLITGGVVVVVVVAVTTAVDVDVKVTAGAVVVMVSCVEEQPTLNTNARMTTKTTSEVKIRFIILSPVFFNVLV
jgi:hypothetical protein